MIIRWCIGLTMLFVIFSVYGNILEQADPLAEAETTVLYKLTSFQRIQGTDTIGTIFAGVGATWMFLTGILDVIWFNYSFLEPSPTDSNFAGLMVKYIIFIPVALGFLITLALTIRSSFAR